jgi:DNA primase catalytic core
MEIAEIKSRLTIAQVLSRYGLKPDKHLRLCCPFHEDKTPSMQVYYKTQTTYCFSSNCPTHGKSLDVIDFIMYREKCTKHEAILKAQDFIGLPSPTAPQPKPMPKPDQPKPTTEERAAFLIKMFTYFKNGVYNSKPAQEYIKSRKLDFTKTEVGYNSGQFHHGARKDETLINQCLQHGLLIDNNIKASTGNPAYTVFGKCCIVFALRNKQNQVTGLYFRSAINDKDQKHFYLKERSGLYPGYPKADTKKLILNEAIIDTASLLLIPEITKEYELLSCFGTNGLTEEHKTAIKELKQLKEVVLFYDGDKAGKEAITKHFELLHQLRPGVKLTYIETPENEDINSLWQGHEKELFTHLLKSRIELFLSTEKSIEKKSSQQEPASFLDTANPEQIIYENTELKVTIWGGIEKENLSRLKVSLHIKNKTDKYKSFRDDVNLYSHGSMQKLVQNIAETLELSTSLVIKTLTDLTEKLEEYRLQERTEHVKALQPKLYEMSEAEKAEATAFLKDKDLIQNTLQAIEKGGLVGEQNNGLLLFLLYLSRFFDEPLHAIIFGKSGSGKTYLQTKVSECLPEESVRTITSLTENTLYYSAKDFWKHKVLLIEDLEGVYNAFLPLREFMSKQSITKLTTDKDAKGNNVQKILTVEGPICVSGATTMESIYEDNANRSYLLHVDETPNHLAEVLQFQRKQQAGLINESTQTGARLVLKNSQRLLKQVKVINHYATDLVIPDCVFKKLRTNMHYLRLIEIITFYHQQQRQWKKSQSGEYYIETSLTDIEWANHLVKETLLRKSDELNGETRQFFETLKTLVKKNNPKQTAFLARDIRHTLRMHPMKLTRFLIQLESRNLLKRISSRQSGYEYEITSFEDYELLKHGVNILDRVLEQLKAKNNGKTTKNGELHTSFTSASQNGVQVQNINIQ